MKLLTKSITALLRKNYERGEHGDGSLHYKDVKPVVKFFNPCGAATWLFSELDPDGDTLFGLCDLGMGCPELGYASLSELAAVKVPPFGLGIERDLWFTPDKTLMEYYEEASKKGRLVA